MENLTSLNCVIPDICDLGMLVRDYQEPNLLYGFFGIKLLCSFESSNNIRKYNDEDVSSMFTMFGNLDKDRLKQV